MKGITTFILVLLVTTVPSYCKSGRYDSNDWDDVMVILDNLSNIDLEKESRGLKSIQDYLDMINRLYSENEAMNLKRITDRLRRTDLPLDNRGAGSYSDYHGSRPRSSRVKMSVQDSERGDSQIRSAFLGNVIR
uniref:Short neuropeptide F n=1 Tax=Haemonchus contortus TaxID=6289 RepID=W6NDN8_HAECO